MLFVYYSFLVLWEETQSKNRCSQTIGTVYIRSESEPDCQERRTLKNRIVCWRHRYSLQSPLPLRCILAHKAVDSISFILYIIPYFFGIASFRDGFHFLFGLLKMGGHRRRDRPRFLSFRLFTREEAPAVWWSSALTNGTNSSKSVSLLRRWETVVPSLPSIVSVQQYTILESGVDWIVGLISHS
jgi:hypothetical protein